MFSCLFEGSIVPLTEVSKKYKLCYMKLKLLILKEYSTENIIKILRNTFNWNGDMKSLTKEMAYHIYVLDLQNIT